MKFLFIDETMKQAHKSKYFLCLCGLLVDSSNLLDLNELILNFRRECDMENLKELRKGPESSKVQKSNELFSILRANNVK